MEYYFVFAINRTTTKNIDKNEMNFVNFIFGTRTYLTRSNLVTRTYNLYIYNFKMISFNNFFCK